MCKSCVNLRRFKFRSFRSIGTKLTKLENMQKSCFICRHVTQKRYVVRHADLALLIGILISGKSWNQPEISMTSGSNVIAQICVFTVTLTMTCVLCLITRTGICMWSFIKIRPVWMGDMPRLKLNALCFIMWYLVDMEIHVTLFLLVRFCYMTHSIGQINVCTDFCINRYRIDEVRKYAKIVFYLMSRE